MSEIFLHDSEQQWTDLGEGVMRKILVFNDELMLMKVRFKKGLSVHFINTPTHRFLMLVQEHSDTILMVLIAS